MIYLFYGNNFEGTRAKCDSFLEQLFAKKPNASFFEYDSENFNKGEFEELLHGQGLFEREHIVVLRGVLVDSEVKEFVLENITTLAKSPNVFVFVEQKIAAQLIKKFETHTKKIWESGDKKGVTEKTFSPFALGDAFGGRDRKKTWALFCRLCDHEGMKPEVVHGILFSQVKHMLLAKRGGENPGVHPFVFQKAKQFARNYSEEELGELSSSLVGLYHDARRGICDMRIALERLILKI